MGHHPLGTCSHRQTTPFMGRVQEGLPMSRSPVRYLAAFGAVLVLSLGLSGCGINTIPTQDEQVKASWSQVLNEYKRRSDLVPNLVATVKGYAKQEQTVLTQ